MNPLAQLVDEVSNELDSDLLLINAPMMPTVDVRLRQVLATRQVKRSRVIVILVTPGGMADVAYRSAAAIQRAYDSVAVCVAGWCKSAGTLLAIGANELIIGEAGELGPLDVQIAKRDDLGGDRDSGLILNEALERLRDEAFGIFENFMIRLIAQSQNNITTRTAADIAAQMAIGLMAPVFEKIDPIRMGADARAMNIGRDYAARLNMKGRNLQGPDALSMLLNGYPSHSFVIDHAEASRLFTNVKALEGKLSAVVALLGEACMSPRHDHIICFLDGVADGEASEEDRTGDGGHVADDGDGAADADPERSKEGDNIQDSPEERMRESSAPRARRRGRSTAKEL